MNCGQSFLALLLIFVCCLLMIVILLQRGRGSGLVGAFGGAGGSSAFGAKTGDVFTWITVVVATVFVMLNVASNFVFDQSPRPAQAAETLAEPETEGAPTGTTTTTGPIKIDPANIQIPEGGGDGTINLTFPPPPAKGTTEGESDKGQPSSATDESVKPAPDAGEDKQPATKPGGDAEGAAPTGGPAPKTQEPKEPGQDGGSEDGAEEAPRP